jgi:HEAT repeat protein
MIPGQRRDLLLSLVVQSNSPEAEAFAHELLISDDPEQIITGLKMIRDSGQPTPEIQADLMLILHNGSSTDVITAALEALPLKVLEPTDQLMVLDTLANYRTHVDEKVRAVAIEKSVLLSDRNIGAELLAQGLSDESPQVRSAAAFSAVSSGIQTETLRQQLFQILENPDEEWSVRHHAFNALGDYRDLRVEEYESLKRFETELTMVSENQSG